jgi:hypothetical protein
MQYGSKFLLPLLLAVGFLVTCTSEGGDDKGGSGGSSSTGTGGSGTGGRGGSSSTGTGGSSSSGSGGSSEGGSGGSEPGTGGSGASTDGGAYAEAGSRPPKLAGQDQFVSPTAGGQPQISLIDGDGNLWWVDLDDHVGF